MTKFNFKIEERKPKRIKITEKYSFSHNHWYGFLPRKWKSTLVKLGIKLGIVKRYGHLMVMVERADGSFDSAEGYNIITDVGIKHIGDILAGDESTNIDLAFMEPGSGTTPAAIGDTDTETPLTPADRLAATNQTRATASPFEVVIEAFVSSTKYTRPQTINELCVFFGPDESGDLFARGVLSSGITLNTNDTATLTYGFVFR